MQRSKNMFTYKIRRVQDQRESNIIPNDPSNIFEFKSKKRKNIDFDIIISPSKKDIKNTNFENDVFKKLTKPIKRIKTRELNKISTNFLYEQHRNKNFQKSFDISFIKPKILQNEEKNLKKNNYNQKNSKKLVQKNKNLNVVKVDFDNLLKHKSNVYEEILNSSKENVEVYKSNKKEFIDTKRKTFENLIEINNISDVLMLFCNENLKNSYAKKLKEELQKNYENFFDMNKNNEQTKAKITEINEEFYKWDKIKESLIYKNTCKVIDFKVHNNFEEDLKIEYLSLDNLKFIESGINVFLSNLTKRIDEIDKQMFDLNKEETGLDSMILLQGFIKFK